MCGGLLQSHSRSTQLSVFHSSSSTSSWVDMASDSMVAAWDAKILKMAADHQTYQQMYPGEADEVSQQLGLAIPLMLGSP